jgi:type I restriction enzyme, S subunit
MRSVPAKIVSEVPSAVWVETEEIQDRVDATYFSAEFLRLDDILTSHDQSSVSPLGNFLREPRRIMYLNTEAFEQEDLPAGTPFISGVDLDEAMMSIKWNTVKRVAPWMLARYPGGKLFDGALLIKVKGPNQLAAYIETAPSDVLVSGTFVMAGVKEIDPWYLASYLTQEYAQAWRTRLRQNITVEFTPYDELAEIPVLKPSVDLQRAIGNKLRKAERLRQRATLAQEDVQRSIDHLFGPVQWDEHGSFGWMPYSAFDEGRLDAWFNQPQYCQMATCLAARPRLQPVSNLARIATDSANLNSHSADHFKYYEIADIDSHSGLITSTSVAIDQAPSRAKYRVQAGDVLVSTVRPNRKAIAIVPEQETTAICSSGFSVLRSNEPSVAYYLRACLMNDIATHQLMRWNTGATYPAIERSVPLSVLIPDPGPEMILHLGSTLRDSSADFEMAHALIQSASSAIAALLDGSLDDVSLLAEGADIEDWLRQNPIATTGRRS